MHCFLVTAADNLAFSLGRDVGVAVALEVAPRGCAVLLPALQTDPAEVVPALGALDVVAAVGLLDGRATVRAGFGVRDQPEEVGGFVVTTCNTTNIHIIVSMVFLMEPVFITKRISADH